MDRLNGSKANEIITGSIDNSFMTSSSAFISDEVIAVYMLLDVVRVDNDFELLVMTVLVISSHADSFDVVLVDGTEISDVEVDIEISVLASSVVDEAS